MATSRASRRRHHCQPAPEHRPFRLARGMAGP